MGPPTWHSKRQTAKKTSANKLFLDKELRENTEKLYLTPLVHSRENTEKLYLTPLVHSYYRARYYNPEIGRFLQTDPIGYGDGMNLCRYCRNNPLNMIDPTGLKSVPVDVCIVIGTPLSVVVGEDNEAYEGLYVFSDALMESVDDWGAVYQAWDMESVLEAVAKIDAKYTSYRLSIQGSIPGGESPSMWGDDVDAADSRFSLSDENPIVQILKKATNAVSIDWRNILFDNTSCLDAVAAVIEYSGSTARNTFVVSTGLDLMMNGSTEVLIFDTGVERGKKEGEPQPDYDIYGAVYSFVRERDNTISYSKTWEYLKGDDENNANQPY